MNASTLPGRTANHLPVGRSRESSVPRQAFGALTLGEGVSFLFMSALHTRVLMPLGFSEPVIVPAVIVEGLCGAVLVIAAFGLLTGRDWRWSGAVAAQAFSLAGVLLGIVGDQRRTGSAL